ncbi:MAG: metallophosphoesterase family protein [Nevskia sp.]|uniref:metallophosphoesterase family protein n=1 Tax=Nevskia sp. TaxID=1929292 RepID=UPI004036C766
MRIALVSDIHGNLLALEAVVADIRRRGVDQIICLGDNISGPLLPRETAQFLMCTDWTILAGNHERQVLTYQPGEGGASDAYAHSQLTETEFSWLRSLKPHIQHSEELFICHGTPRSDCEHFLESVRSTTLAVASSAEVAERLGDLRSQVVACGHSHVPRAMRLPSGQLLVNPGSVGLQAYLDGHPVPYTVELGTTDAQYAIVEKLERTWMSSHFAVPYHFESMANLARQRNRPDWERALLLGYVR